MNNKHKKICFITATRAEYGLLKWTMKDIIASGLFQFQLIVTGAHLLTEQGHTIDTISDDGFSITSIVDVSLDNSSPKSIAESMGKMSESFSNAFSILSPDYIVVLGDRYELLPIVNTAFIMQIPIIHISGGDITEGAIDDGIRNAVTMLATYHFPGTAESSKNIIRMRNSDKNIWVVGEPGLDFFTKEDLLTRKELEGNLHLNSNNKWVLFTLHPETKQNLDYNNLSIKNSIEALLSIDDIQIVATYANTDFGGQFINQYLESIANDHPNKLKVIPSLGNKRYLSFMKQVSFVIGNSSSGIIEAPMLGIPVINIGDRQKGRHMCNNIIQSNNSKASITSNIKKALNSQKQKPDYYWGDGHTSEKIVSILTKVL